jgi:hypothetical protein
MNRKRLVILITVVLIVLGLLSVFVFKVRGSTGRSTVSGCVPYNVEVSKSDQYQATIIWNTVDECLGYVTYGDSRKDLDFIAVDSKSLTAKAHAVTVNKLLPSQTYYFLIYSGDKAYGNKGVPLSFSLSSL